MKPLKYTINHLGFRSHFTTSNTVRTVTDKIVLYFKLWYLFGFTKINRLDKTR